MRILFWVPYPTEGASNRYRVEQYLPFLRGKEIKYSLHPFWSSAAFNVLYRKDNRLKKIYFFISGTICRIIDILQIFRFDLVFIHREAYPLGGAFFERILSLSGKPFVFDFDDAIFLKASSPPNNFIERLKDPGKVAKIVKMSSHVIAGNKYLADFAVRHNRRVTVIPTPIDTEKSNFNGKRRAKTGVVIGWIGSITTSCFLESLRNVFAELSARFSGIRFKIVGGIMHGGGLFEADIKPWSLKDEAFDLNSFDIGVMPMPDNEWTRGKCGFKTILYMSSGIPSVSSPVGVNTEIINDGINGFLAASEKEWLEKISLLIENRELYAKISMAGRQTVEARYSLKVNTPLFLGIIDRAYKEVRRISE